MVQVLSYILGYATLAAMAFTIVYTWRVIDREVKEIELLEKGK